MRRMSSGETWILSSLEGRSVEESASAVEAGEPFCLVGAVCRERRVGLEDDIVAERGRTGRWDGCWGVIWMSRDGV